MKSKVLTVIVLVAIVSVLLLGACSAGFIAGRVLLPGSRDLILEDIPLPPGISESAGLEPNQGNGTPADLEQLFEPFWQAWNLVHEQYVDQPVDDTVLMRGAIKGMLEALDDSHTSYLDPIHYESTTAQLEGSAYEGIGAWVDTRREYLTIISPIPGSPAEKAGLQPGDQIIGVDGEDMTGIAGEAVRQKVIGPEGTTVRLEILREGQEPFEVVVERASIKPPDLESRMMEGNIAYLRLINFSSSASRDLHLALEELMAQNPAGLILDLRNNGGGYLDTGISVVSEFVGEGVVMYEDFGEGERKTFEAEPGGLATDIPLVVLINEGSASASEIVAGAIQARGRGLLVGQTSYGKGSVQVFTPLVDEQGGVRITIARWLTPDGKTIHEAGLTPDEVVEMQVEDLEAGRDPQLDKGVELLTR